MGTGADGAGGSGASSDGGAGGSGEGGSKSGEGAGKGTGTFDREALDPALRSLDPEQINGLFTTLVTGLREAGRAAPAAEVKKVDEIPDLTDAELKEFFDPASEKFNPRAAIARLAEKNYGPILSDIGNRATVGIYNKIGTEYPDFKNFQAKVQEALAQRDPRTLSEEVIFGTYLTLKGLSVVQEDRKKAGRTAGTETIIDKSGKSADGDEEADIELTAVEKDVAKRMFPNATDPVATYKAALTKYQTRDTVKVPVGRNAKGEVIKE